MKKRLAIIGTGIAGLGSAYFLQHQYDITLFERNGYAGGHSNTVFVSEEGSSSPKLAIDTGFMVYNPVNYPNLLKLFSHLGVTSYATDMSFSLNSPDERMVWSEASFKRLFCDTKNLFNTRYWAMLLQLNRFNQEAEKALESGQYENDTLAEYVRKCKYSDDLLNWYLIPMSSAIWSTPPEPMLQFPATTLIRFFQNHGFLGQNTQHQWYTVEGGSQAYVQKLIEPFRSRILLNAAVKNVFLKNGEGEDGVTVELVDGRKFDFDQVVFATHANETLALLNHPTHQQQRLLSAFQYQENHACLHSDENVMPSCKPCWASWNYRLDKDGSASTHYWMNSLQQLATERQYFVSLNASGLIRSDRVVKEMTYHHPIFSKAAVKAQKELPDLNSAGPLYFCGSYFRYGFHEDAFTSALALARNLLNEPNLWC